MKLLLPLTACLLTITPTSPSRAQSAPKTQRERLGYALGAEIGATFKQQGVDFDVPAFNAAVRDAMAGNHMQMTSSQIQDMLMSLNKGSQPKPPATDQTASEKNRKEGEAFLAANRTKPGVVVLPSGLQYKVLREGTGALPLASDRVTVKYRGMLVNGTEFDNSEKHGSAGTLTFAVSGETITGWTEALLKMRTGAKWQLFIPASLAYGDQQIGTDIGPGSTLIFDVELVSIKK